METPEIVRLIALIGVLVLVAPGAWMAFRDRRAAFRNAAIWVALAGAAVLLFWVLFPPQ